MIKARPDLQDESIKLYEIWKQKGMKYDELENIIYKYGSIDLKKRYEGIKAEPEFEA